MLAATGIVNSGEENAGALAGLVSEQSGKAVGEEHEVLANITLALVLVHIAAVLFASFAHHKKHQSSSPKPSSTKATSASMAGRASSPSTSMWMQCPCPAASIMSPMIDVPPTV